MLLRILPRKHGIIFTEFFVGVVYCVYYAKSEELVRQHAMKAGIPANLISKVGTIISPATAE